MKNTLESSKFFPIIAWALVISFATFTYFLSVKVQDDLGNISTSVERLEEKIDTMGEQQKAQKSSLVEDNTEVQ